MASAGISETTIRKWPFLAVRNWRRFQHYHQDRRPPWIKLYLDLIDDHSFSTLGDREKIALVLIWLLAAKTDNKIPNDAEWIRRRVGLKRKPDLTRLVRARFLIRWRTGEEPSESEERTGEGAGETKGVGAGNASKPLAPCKQGASLESEESQKSESESIERKNDTDLTFPKTQNVTKSTDVDGDHGLWEVLQLDKAVFPRNCHNAVDYLERRWLETGRPREGPVLPKFIDEAIRFLKANGITYPAAVLLRLKQTQRADRTQ